MSKASKTLVAIRSDDYHAIKLSYIERDVTDTAGHTADTVDLSASFTSADDYIVPCLTLVIEDGNGSHVFSFADAYELRTFSERMLEQAGTLID